MTTLDKKHDQEETLDVPKLTKEETISEVLPTNEMAEAESSEHETPMYLWGKIRMHFSDSMFYIHICECKYNLLQNVIRCL